MARNVKRVARIQPVTIDFRKGDEPADDMMDMTIDIQQEIYCHACGNYVQFTIPDDINEDIVLDCPNCGHKHYRRVDNGEITESRWGQDPSQNPTQFWNITASGWTNSSTYDGSAVGRMRMYGGTANSSGYGAVVTGGTTA